MPRSISASVIAGGGEQRLRNLGVPESHIREVLAGKNPMSLDWPAPATGDVIEKQVILGQRVRAGDELYRIADHTHLWVIADVAEADLPQLKHRDARHRDVARLSDAAVRGRGGADLSGAAGGDAHRAGPHRGAQSRTGG